MFNETSYSGGLSGEKSKARKLARTQMSTAPSTDAALTPIKPYMDPKPVTGPAATADTKAPAGSSIADTLKNIPTMYWLIGGVALFFVMGKR